MGVIETTLGDLWGRTIEAMRACVGWFTPQTLWIFRLLIVYLLLCAAVRLLGRIFLMIQPFAQRLCYRVRMTATALCALLWTREKVDRWTEKEKNRLMKLAAATIEVRAKRIRRVRKIICRGILALAAAGCLIQFVFPPVSQLAAEWYARDVVRMNALLDSCASQQPTAPGE